MMSFLAAALSFEEFIGICVDDSGSNLLTDVQEFPGITRDNCLKECFLAMPDTKGCGYHPDIGCMAFNKDVGYGNGQPEALCWRPSSSKSESKY